MTNQFIKIHEIVKIGFLLNITLQKSRTPESFQKKRLIFMELVNVCHKKQQKLV